MSTTTHNMVNPYNENGLEAGCRAKVFDSFAESLEKNVNEDLAKAIATDVYLKNDGDPDFTSIVTDTFADHFTELWNVVELVSMDEEEIEDDSGVAELIPNQKMYYDNNMNVLLIGPHGTGKTYSIQAFCQKYGIKLKYFSCSTLDPYTDLVGIPVPKVDANGNDYLKMIREHDIDDAEFIFFDEFNRADSQTMNAVFEIIQFKTINGEPLPNLKCCWAAMNPADGDYTVSESDPALIDRFHAYIKLEPKPSVAYLKQFMDLKVAKALVRWWNNHETKQRNANLKKERMHYISPRRLEMMGRTWMLTKSGPALLRCLPPNGEYDSGRLIDMLEKASGMKEVNETASKELGFPMEKGFIKSNFDIVGATIKGDVTAQLQVMDCLFKGSGPAVIREQYQEFIDKYCDASAVETLINNLPATKRSNLRSEYTAYSNEVKGTKVARVLGL